MDLNLTPQPTNSPPINEGKPGPSASAAQRWGSLDMLRGIAIAGMMVVNMAGLETTYPWLAHADWNGFTLADWVFPGFLFVVGAAMAMGRQFARQAGPGPSFWLKVMVRTAMLFGLGLLLNGFWQYDWANLRWLGVLQRIAICYALARLILLLPRRAQYGLGLAVLLGSWGLLSGLMSGEGLVPTGLAPAGLAPAGLAPAGFTRTDNFGAWLDRLVIPAAHLYRGDRYQQLGDPEGLLGSLTAVVNVLAGYWSGLWLRRQRLNPASNPARATRTLAIAGCGCLLIGALWNFTLPINKKLWTSSYVVFSTGWSLLLWAWCHELADVRHWRWLTRPLEILGRNAIALFVLSVLLIKLLVKLKFADQTPYALLLRSLAWMGTENATVAIALATLGLWWVVAWGWYRRGWFWKI